MSINNQELVDAALKLLPELVERSAEIDTLRQLPQDLAETLAYANGSLAWCIFVGSTSQYLLGALPAVQQREMLSNLNVITSGVFADIVGGTSVLNRPVCNNIFAMFMWRPNT